MRRAVLVVNPQAHTVEDAARRAVVDRLTRSVDVEEVETKGPGHATEIARLAVDARADLVVVLGGDGTLNEAVQGLAGSDVPVGIVPGGGANVFARALGIPRDLLEATGALLAAADGPGRRVPLGRVDGRVFLANCGIGFDAAIVRRVEAVRARKGRVTDGTFVWAGLRLFFGAYDRGTPHLSARWTEDGGVLQTRPGQFMVVVQNAEPYTYLGSRAMRLCPSAPLGDGLAVFALDSMRTSIALRVLGATFGRARHGRNRHVAFVGGLAAVTVEADRPMDVQADGEYLGERDRLEITAMPDALTVLA
jgi:diacylglycerol kinase family enzyme